MKTVIIGDSCTDLPIDYIRENGVPIISYPFTFQGQMYFDDFGKSMPYADFYRALRNGEMPTTSQANVHALQERFLGFVRDGSSLIYLSFSSALSNTYNNALLARKLILEEFPQADISVIDTKCASLGEGLILYYAMGMLERGASKEEIVDWVEKNKLKMNHWFTVEDLDHLHRGGRVSGAAAFIGTVLDIKPVLHVDNEGRLIPVLKVRSRKKSVKTLAELLEERILEPEKQTIAISHGDCLSDALFLKKMILEKVSVKNVIINHVGPVIGSHSGPGTLALFFLGENR